jgi:hypothetical protein
VARRKPTALRTFLTAILYGAALVAAPTNTLVFLLGLQIGQPNWSSLSLALLGWGLILYIHHQRGWPPFRRR